MRHHPHAIHTKDMMLGRCTAIEFAKMMNDGLTPTVQILRSALMCDAKNSVIEVILMYGIDVNEPDEKDRRSLLAFAVQLERSDRVIKLLLRHKATFGKNEEDYLPQLIRDRKSRNKIRKKLLEMASIK